MNFILTASRTKDGRTFPYLESRNNISTQAVCLGTFSADFIKECFLQTPVEIFCDRYKGLSPTVAGLPSYLWLDRDIDHFKREEFIHSLFWGAFYMLRTQHVVHMKSNQEINEFFQWLAAVIEDFQESLVSRRWVYDEWEENPVYEEE